MFGGVCFVCVVELELFVWVFEEYYQLCGDVLCDFVVQIFFDQCECEIEFGCDVGVGVQFVVVYVQCVGVDGDGWICLCECIGGGLVCGQVVFFQQVGGCEDECVGVD